MSLFTAREIGTQRGDAPCPESHCEQEVRLPGAQGSHICPGCHSTHGPHRWGLEESGISIPCLHPLTQQPALMGGFPALTPVIGGSLQSHSDLLNPEVSDWQGGGLEEERVGGRAEGVECRTEVLE